MIHKCYLAYKFSRYYPICTDSFEDLIDMFLGKPKPKSDLTQLSSLFPIIAEWLYILDNERAYNKLLAMLKECFSHTNLQMWFPDENTEKFLFKENASYNSGDAYCSICLPEKMSDLQMEIKSISKRVYNANNISCLKLGMPILALIACRHFRTPLFSALWHELVLLKENQQPPESVDELSGIRS